jgi:cytochrome b6-f complex iron-sulfur subunit
MNITHRIKIMPRFKNSLEDDTKPSKTGMSRRRFLAIVGLGAASTALFAMLGSILTYLLPNRLGGGASYSVGKLTDVMKANGRVFKPINKSVKVFVDVDGDRVRVQTAICTHLGCTVNAVNTGYSCPCHGSVYDRDGLNVAGPAPSPLLFYGLYVSPANELVVDTSRSITNPDDAWFKPS